MKRRIVKGRRTRVAFLHGTLVIVCALGWIVLNAQSCSCDPALVDVPPCKDGETQPCVGQCGDTGVATCFNSTWGPCERVRVPADVEICNRIDDDCDGYTDEDFPRRGKVCGSGVGACKVGLWRCSDAGEEICGGSVGPRLIPGCTPADGDCGLELCNGLDDDCDGFTDENVAVGLCYTGPPDTVISLSDGGMIIKGECRPGIGSCVGGEVRCTGDILPDYASDECMDQKDYDCDGLVRTQSATPMDIIFSVDRSWSMSTSTSGIEAAKLKFLALVAPYPEIWVGGVRLDSNYAGDTTLAWDLEPARDVLDKGYNFGGLTGGGAEPTLGAILGVTRVEAPFYPSWRPGARHIAITFTDESCQHVWCKDRDRVPDPLTYCETDSDCGYPATTPFYCHPVSIGPTGFTGECRLRIRGCQEGHWCDRIVSTGHILTPLEVNKLSRGDVEHILFKEASSLWYDDLDTLMTRDIVHNPEQMSELLFNTLIELTCNAE